MLEDALSEERLASFVLGGWQAAKLVTVVALCFGAFSAIAPQRSIALYQWLMARFNWRVSPIDAPRERRTTILLGLLIVVLSLVGLWLLCSQRL